MTLSEFLLARIAEDEQAARSLSGTAYSAWHFEPDALGRTGGRVAGLGQHAEVANDWSSPHHPAGYVGISPHIARWDPARVLAECEAKRTTIAVCTASGPYLSEHYRMDPDATNVILRALALPYADHPKFREEWRSC